MEKHRCGWCEGDELYKAYHDNEWGVPVKDDATLFEFLILETFQAGLSWITILRKRENFRKAFDNFDYRKIASYNQAKKDELLQDAGIIRNRLKVNATITNARAYLKVQEEFESFSNYIWAFVNGKPIKNSFENYRDAPANFQIQSAKTSKKGGSNLWEALSSMLICRQLVWSTIMKKTVFVIMKFSASQMIKNL